MESYCIGMLLKHIEIQSELYCIGIRMEPDGNHIVLEGDWNPNGAYWNLIGVRLESYGVVIL